MRLLVVPGVVPVPDAPGRSRTDSLASVTVDDLRAIAAGGVLRPVLTTGRPSGQRVYA